MDVVELDDRHGSFTIAAEVGLLSHNIKVIGESYPEQQKQAFGARILVGTYSYEGDTFLGLFLFVPLMSVTEQFPIYEPLLYPL